ncbi:hypothetical protein MJO28_011201 [Puccinia striiformis f. sp. tritici]|uniref:Uncharacterized protein n=1 Tax=Puccinia striiformis f. sp. tritici TaxID=168172 RepID=A0ACC0E4G1_9BASI|nr:hypothetical protein MJO28_011201 [Puccinia striiformis f. sp. tritici]
MSGYANWRSAQLFRQCSQNSANFGDLQVFSISYSVNGNKIFPHRPKGIQNSFKVTHGIATDVTGTINNGDGTKVAAVCPRVPNQQILSACPDQFCSRVS